MWSFWQRQQQWEEGGKIKVGGGEKSTRLGKGERWEVRKRRKTGLKVQKKRIANCKFWWSVEALWQRINWETYVLNTDWVGLHEVLWDSVCSVSLTATLQIHVWPHSTFLYIHMGLQLASALQWGSYQSYSAEWGAGGFKPAAPLPFQLFDQAKVMFTCLATSVTKTAIRNHTCLVGVETLVLYLNQAEEKRSMV